MKNVKKTSKKRQRYVKPATAKLANMVAPESLIALENFRRNLPNEAEVAAHETSEHLEQS